MKRFPDNLAVADTKRSGISALKRATFDSDLIIMGALSRTGVPGYFIGNTSENILNQVRCSVLTLKPDGFVSPVEP